MAIQEPSPLAERASRRRRALAIAVPALALIAACSADTATTRSDAAPTIQVQLAPGPVNPLNGDRILRPPPAGATTSLTPQALLATVRQSGGINPDKLRAITMRLGLIEVQDPDVPSSPGDLHLVDRLVVVISGQASGCAPAGPITPPTTGACYISEVIDASTGQLLCEQLDGS